MRRISKVVKYLFLNFIFIIILLEIAGIFIFDNNYYWDQRYFYLSEHAIVNQEINIPGLGLKQFWAYAPNDKIRTMAAYATFIGSWIEYDCEFSTNRFGLIDTKADLTNLDYVVLGDSFTEGQGGCPWLTYESISNSKINNINLINSGLQGTGIRSFEVLLSTIEVVSKPKNIVIIAISNDFKRGDVVKWNLDNPCAMDLQCDGKDYWHFINPNMSKSIPQTISNLSHALKEPLTSIKGYSQLLLETFQEQLSDNVKSTIKNIFEQTILLENKIISF